MPLWAKIYWVVAIALFGVWVWRRVQSRRSHPPASVPGGTQMVRADTSATASVTPPLASTPARPPAAGEPEVSVTKQWPAPPPPDPNDTSYRLDPLAAEPDSADPVISANDPGFGALGDTGRGSAPKSTLPELLAGITLPHELVPLTQIDTDIDLATHVVVATKKVPAETVAEGLVAELERLGYQIERPTMTELTAQGERGTLRLLIHPDGSHVHDGGTRRFPTAEEKMVVVELFAG